jgi:hypothetical protein
MKNRLLNLSILMVIVLLGTSCKKKHNVEFEHEKYSLYYDENIKLNITTTENLSNFYFTSQDTNVVKVNKNGIASGVFVGITTVTVSNGELSNKCSVTVAPYEKLFIVPLLNLSLITKEGLKAAEQRPLKSEYDNVLCYYPFESEYGIDSLTYIYNSNNEVLQITYLKNNINDDAISLFLTERYRKSGDKYIDHNTGAELTYKRQTANENAEIVYVF